MTLKPQLGLAEVYNDNLFAQTENKTADLTSVISPGLGVLVGKRSDDYLTLNYTFNQYIYADRTDLNTSEHLLELNANLEGKRIGLRGTDRVQLLSSPLGNERLLDVQSPDLSFAAVESNIDRTTFYDSYMLSYRTSEKTSVYGQGVRSRIDYEDRAFLFDITTYSGTGGFGFQAFPKTVLFGEGFYGTTTSEANPAVVERLTAGGRTVSSIGQQVTFIGGGLGARGSFTPKLAGLVRAGYEVREIEDGASLPGAPVVNLGLTYQYSPKTVFTVNYVRRQDVSVYFERQSYTSDVISVQANQSLGSKGKWKATGGGYYALYDYSPAEELPHRSYNVYTLYFSLAYQVQQWLTSSLSYERTSVLGGSTDVTAYDANRITLRFSIGY
ncbi:MAG: hypothetical protein L0Z50_05570 [Verrucomicrobiales bacterium]|nr:hypothetical protein [Verrucomicrobiales bacterium]